MMYKDNNIRSIIILFLFIKSKSKIYKMTNKIITVGIIGSRERDSQEDYLILVNKFERIIMRLSEKYDNLIIRSVRVDVKK